MNGLPTGYRPAKQVAGIYKANSEAAMGEREMMAQIHQKIINHLYLGRDAYLANNIEAMLEQNLKVIHIADVLRGEMHASGKTAVDAEAVIAAKFHEGLYLQLLERTTNILMAKPPEDEFNALIEMVKPVYQAWAPQKADATAPAENTPQPANINTAG